MNIFHRRYVSISLLFLFLALFFVFDTHAENTPEIDIHQVIYSEISSGSNHACALTDDNQLKCWGSNSWGQIGAENYNFISRSTPARVPGLEEETLTQFVAGSGNTCIINSQGTLKCWGSNGNKQLGNPAIFRDEGVPIPVINMDSDVISVGIGNGFICGLKSDGEVYCWGLDYYESIVIQEPTLIATIPEAKSIKSNGSHSCVLTENGELYCWGQDQKIPLKVAGLSNVVDFSLGEYSTSCAITGSTETNDQELVCWGGYAIDEYSTYISIENGIPRAVALGKEHKCMIFEVNSVPSVYCMGNNQEGQVGNGSTTFVEIPTLVAGTEGAVAISAGDYHSNVVLSDGTIKSWGGNSQGQLGDGSFFRRQLPIHLDSNVFPEGISDVVSGENHTCALTLDGGIKCWGGNLNGQVGNGSINFTKDPTLIVDSVLDAKQISAGNYHTCSLLNSGEVLCWGRNVFGMLGTGHLEITEENLSTPQFVILEKDGERLKGVVKIDCGRSHTCALLEDGKLKCWGANNFGQLGSPIPPDGPTIVPFPTEVTFQGEFSDFANGGDHTCGISSGKTYCWGVNYNGELGLGFLDFEYRPSPTPINYPKSDAVEIDSGGDRTCIRTDLGNINCWGNYSGYEYNQGEVFPVEGLRGKVKLISTGGNTSRMNQHTCVVIEDTGAVQCWGENAYSQLGDGTYDNYTSVTPVDVVGLSGNSSSVTASGDSTCAMFESGSAACWGFNYQIQTLPVDLIEVDEMDRPPSIFFSNYDEGAPNSFFVITGLYFPPIQTVSIYIDDVLMGNILANETGTFKFFATIVEEGEHVIRVESVVQTFGQAALRNELLQIFPSEVGAASLTITIEAGSILRIKEGDGYTIGLVDYNNIYLPLLIR